VGHVKLPSPAGYRPQLYKILLNFTFHYSKIERMRTNPGGPAKPMQKALRASKAFSTPKDFSTLRTQFAATEPGVYA